MKKTYGIISVISLCILGFIPNSVYVTAHTPTYMVINYNQNNSILTVNITHPVSDNITHYVAGVKICLQENIFKTYNYTSQPTKEFFQYFYNIEASTGDKIKVAAYCNEGGEIHDNLVVGSIIGNVNTIPGFQKLGLISIFFFLMLMLFTIKRIK